MTLPVEKIKQLVQSQRSLHLSTINEDLSPLSSYAPFYLEDSLFYVFLSRLASHYENLVRSPKVSIMIIEDDADCSDIFARQRLEFLCKANVMASEHAESDAILSRFETKAGETFSLLRSLPDFSLFQLSPMRGSFVEGFGRAFELKNGHFLQS